MSYYDPFQLYHRSQAKSHKGQVLRKKYYPYQGLTLSDDDIKRVIETLKNLNYRIFAPGEPFPSPPSPPPPLPVTRFQNLVQPVYTETISFNSPETSSTLLFSMVWERFYDVFASILAVDPSSVSNFSFVLSLISINLYGQFQFESDTGTSGFSIYFSDPNSSLSLPNLDSSFVQDSDDNLLSLQSIDLTSYLESFIIHQTNPTPQKPDSRSYIDFKAENQDNPYLWMITNTDPNLISILRNKDYNSFNPSLYHLVYSGTRTGSCTISDSDIIVQVHIQYDV